MSEVSAWALWLRAAGASDATVYLRTYHVARVMREIRVDPWSLTTEQLLLFLGSQSWKAETRRSYRASLRVFYSWAQATGRRQDNPAALLPRIQLPRRQPRPTPESAYRRAVMIADDDVALMVHLAAQCGLRRGEIARVRREQVTEDVTGGMSLYVIGKGAHERLVPLPAGLAEEILSRPAGWLFPSPSPRSKLGHLTPAHVGKVVSAVLPDEWTCHTLRHRCATVAYWSTRDLRAVQELLGHAKPETTALYTQLPVDAVRRAMEAAAA